MKPESLAKKIYKFLRGSGFDVNWATSFMEYGVPEGSLAMRVSNPKSKSVRDTYGVTVGLVFVTPQGGVVIKGKDKKVLEDMLGVR